MSNIHVSRNVITQDNLHYVYSALSIVTMLLLKQPSGVGIVFNLHFTSEKIKIQRRLSIFPNVIWIINARVGIQNQAVSFQKLLSYLDIRPRVSKLFHKYLGPVGLQVCFATPPLCCGSTESKLIYNRYMSEHSVF